MVRDTTFSSICVPIKVPDFMINYGLVIMFSHPSRSFNQLSSFSASNAFSQTIIITLTLWRHFLSLRRGIRLPIVTLMVRDGAITFAAVFGA